MQHHFAVLPLLSGEQVSKGVGGISNIVTFEIGCLSGLRFLAHASERLREVTGYDGQAIWCKVSPTCC